MGTPANSIPQITQNDLKDPNLFRLNNIFNALWGQLSSIFTSGQQTSIGATITAPNLRASAQTVPPTDGSTLVTLDTGNTLWGPQNQRVALTTSVSPNNTPTVQPITPGGGGSSTITTLPGNKVIDGYANLIIVSNAVTIDIGLALNFLLTLNQATRVTVNNPIFTGGTIVAGQRLYLYVLTDATTNRPTPAFGVAFGSDVSGAITSGQANTRSVYMLKFHGDSLWHIDNFITGQPAT